MTDFKWFDVETILSRGILANFVLSERGAGKTRSSKEKVIKRFRKKGRKFIFLKRTEEELKATVNDFFNDISDEKTRFKYERRKFYIGDRTVSKNDENMDVEEIVWQEFGYALALSTVSKLKGIPFEDVDIILWDEWVPFDGRYLPNEATRLLNVLETVFRMRENGQLIALGNKNETGHYPIFYDLGLPVTSAFEDDKIYTFKENTILIYSFTNKAHVAAKLKTKLGKLAKGTDYADSMIDNFVEPKFADLVIEKPKRLIRGVFTLVVGGEYFNVYLGAVINNKSAALFIERSKSHLKNVYALDASKPTVQRLVSNGYNMLYGYIVSNMTRYDSQVTAQKIIEAVAARKR